MDEFDACVEIHCLPRSMTLELDDEGKFVLHGYRFHTIKRIVTWILIILSLGLLRLVLYWKPDWMLILMYKRCSFKDADTILIVDDFANKFVEKVGILRSDNSRSGGIPNDTALMVTGHEPIGDSSLSPLLNEYKKESIRYFICKRQKFIYNSKKGIFDKLLGLDQGVSCSFLSNISVLSSEERAFRKFLYGDNRIEVHVASICKLLFSQVLNPFYIFQIFSLCLWFSDEYYYYSGCILFVSVISIAVYIYDVRHNERKLKRTISGSESVSLYKDDHESIEISSDHLVPGDIIVIPKNGCNMKCDAVIINGNCIVNESMLTGESVPVMKTQLPAGSKGALFNIKDHSRHVLFSGTTVIQTRFYGSEKVKALVIRTGFETAKGELVRSILFPKPSQFKFSQDSYKFIGVLAIIASIGMIYTLIIMVQRGDPVDILILRILDLITIVIPPALPAAMTVGVVFAQKRLKRLNVYCINTNTINVAGALNCFCFDKTGTLTEDGMDVWGVIPSDNKFFGNPMRGTLRGANENLIACMASCHSLTYIDNKLSGDPLDLKMFIATEWELEEDCARFDLITPIVVHPKVTSMSEEVIQIGVIRQFTFSSSLQRMSVITKSHKSKYFELYSKGSPEKISELCDESTLPANFSDVLMYYTNQGYRVIALAHRFLKKLKYVKIHKVERLRVEKDLTFLGLLIMENRLKSATKPVITTLKKANIRPLMITGDNMLTALSVAKDCGMIDVFDKVILFHATPPKEDKPASLEWMYAENSKSDVEEIHRITNGHTAITISDSEKFHLAVTGKSWSVILKYFPEIIPRIVIKGTVFARMAPEQKMQLIEKLQFVGYYVGMCGDGANDCGALRTAHAGISLSDTEASVASPFTSKHPNIECVVSTIREGRAALVTSFGIFKYMACYSLTQFTTVCFLYWVQANLSDIGFLWIDLFLLTTLCLTFGSTQAHEKLYSSAPPVSLISPIPILSIVSQMVVIISFQIGVYFWTTIQPWYEKFDPPEGDEENYVTSYETGVLTLLSSYQYIILAIVLSKGYPYRKSIFTNYAFLISLLVLTTIQVLMTVLTADWTQNLFEMNWPPNTNFLWILALIAFLNFMICLVLETFIVESEYLKVRLVKIARQLFHFPESMLSKLEYEFSSPHWLGSFSKSNFNLADILRIESVGNHENNLAEDKAVLLEEKDDDSISSISEDESQKKH